MKKIEIQQRKKLVILLLKQGLTPKKVAEKLRKLKISYHFILRTVKAEKLPLEGSGGKNRIVQKNVFDANTDQSRYWIGFLAADGCIQAPNGLSLHIKDIAHLYKYRNFINKKLNVYYRINEAGNLMGTVIFRHTKTYDYLKSLGFVNAKSLTLKLNTPIDSALLRGIFDGDGSVCADGPKITTASPHLLQQISDYLDKHKIKFSVSNKGVTTPCYDIIVRGDGRFLFFDLIYENSTIHLLRKYKKFRAVLKKFRIKNTGLIAGSLSLWK